MTRDEILLRFPKASESFIRANATDMNPAYTATQGFWKKEEIAILASYYSDTAPADFAIEKIAKTLGRSWPAVALKASKLGFTRKRTDPKVHSDAARAKMSVSQKKRAANDPSLGAGLAAYRESGQHGFAGKHHTPENRKKTSERFKKQISENGHPRGMLGKKHTKEFCAKISAVHAGKTVPPEQIMRMLKTKEANGTLVNPRPQASWKCGWEVVGGKRFYARSRWEANYGRYLEWQKAQGLIVDWEHEPKTFWFEGIKRGVMSYLPDFWVRTKSGEEFHEVKGWMDARSLTKIKRMAKYHPSVKLQVIDSVRYRILAKQLKSIVPGWA